MLLHTDTQVSVNGGVTGSSSQVLVLSVGNVEVRLGVAVLLGEAEVDDIDLVATLADAHQEVVRLDVTVDERLGVDVLDARDELVGQQENGLERELAVAEVEQVLQTGAEQVQHHGIVVTFGTEPANEGDANTTSEGLVDTGLVFELRVLGLDALELDGDLLAGDDVGSQVDVTERTRADLAADAVLVTDSQVLRSCVRLCSCSDRLLTIHVGRKATYHGRHLGRCRWGVALRRMKNVVVVDDDGDDRRSVD